MEPRQAPVRIATYNVNGVNGRLARLREWLEETAPDVACLQEIKTQDANCPAEAVAALGYRSLWHGQRRHHGVAILSRRPLRELRRGLPGGEADAEARYLEAEIGDLVVASVYLPNGNPQPGPRFAYKLAWFDRLVDHALTLRATGRPTVLAGDFNVVPTDFDIANPGWWRDDAVMQPESRAAWRRLLAQGWVDATRELYPRDRIYTFWTTHRAFARNAGFRMDFLALSPGLVPRLAASGVDTEVRGREGASDHAPVWVELGEA